MKHSLPLRLIFAVGTVVALGCGSIALSQVRSVIPHTAAKTKAQPIAAQPTIPTDITGVFTNQGQRRTYYLHTPPHPTAARALPLVVALHGSGMQGREMADTTALSQLADKAGFVVVYPDGLKQKWNVSGQSPEDNVQFVHALIDQIQKIRTIDSQRIYVVGLSNGGILAQKIACEAPQQIAAIATVAASLPHQFASRCQTQQPVSLLMVNGTSDSVVPWQGGAAPQVKVGRGLSIPPIPDVVKFWQQHNGCPANAAVSSSTPLVQTIDYAACQANSEVMLITLNGADHVWTGGGYGQSSFGDTTERVWQFFQRHSLNPS